MVRPSKFFDSLAIGMSVFCVLHCIAAVVFVVGTGSLLATATHHEGFHVIALLVAIPATLYGLLGGLHVHKCRLCLRIGLSGLAVMAAALWFDGAGEAVVTSAGGFLVIVAHSLNLRKILKSAAIASNPSTARGSG